MDDQEKTNVSTNAFTAFLDSMRGQTVLRGVEIGLVALSLAASTAALIVVLTRTSGVGATTHLVSFRNYDNSLVASETINDGEVATEPEVIPVEPTDSKNVYSFAGWGTDFTDTITSDITYTAQYVATPLQSNLTVASYKVRFLNDDNTDTSKRSILYTCSISSGEKATYQGVTPTKACDATYTYSFAGWDSDPSTVTITSNKDFLAKYDKTLIPVVSPVTQYTVRFLNEDGSVLYYENVASGSVASYGSVTPTKDSTSKASYKFAGWDKDVTTAITADTDFKAKYDTYYQATFLNKDGTFIDRIEVKAGTTPKIDTSIIPTMANDGYSTLTFEAWREKVTGNKSTDCTMTENMTFVASYTESYAMSDGLVLTPDSETNTSYYSVTGYTGTDAYVLIPSIYKGCPVTTIADSVFYAKMTVTHIMGLNITTIGNASFECCSNLEEVNFPSTKTIGEEAFYNDQALTNFDFSSVTSLGTYAFYYCTSMVSFSGNKLVTIPSYAFFHCDSLARPSFSLVTSIEQSAFSYCNSLTYASFPKALTLGGGVFWNCPNLTMLSFPLVTEIGSNAFMNDTGLFSIASSNFGSLLTIGVSAFDKCIHLTSVSLKLVTTIADDAFGGCTQLAYLDVPSLTSATSYAFTECYSLSIVRVQDPSLFNKIVANSKVSLSYQNTKSDYDTIAASTFSNLTTLTSVTFQTSLTTIGANAFSNTGLLTMPMVSPNCTIGDNAFSKCQHLEGITLTNASANLSLGYHSFSDIGGLGSLTLPANIAFTGASPFYGDYLECSCAKYASKLVNFTSIVSTYNAAYPNSPLLPTGSKVSCTDGVYTFA